MVVIRKENMKLFLVAVIASLVIMSYIISLVIFTSKIFKNSGKLEERREKEDFKTYYKKIICFLGTTSTDVIGNFFEYLSKFYAKFSFYFHENSLDLDSSVQPFDVTAADVKYDSSLTYGEYVNTLQSENYFPSPSKIFSASKLRRFPSFYLQPICLLHSKRNCYLCVAKFRTDNKESFSFFQGRTWFFIFYKVILQKEMLSKLKIKSCFCFSINMDEYASSNPLFNYRQDISLTTIRWITSFLRYKKCCGSLRYVQGSINKLSGKAYALPTEVGIFTGSYKRKIRQINFIQEKKWNKQYIHHKKDFVPIYSSVINVLESRFQNHLPNVTSSKNEFSLNANELMQENLISLMSRMGKLSQNQNKLIQSQQPQIENDGLQAYCFIYQFICLLSAKRTIYLKCECNYPNLTQHKIKSHPTYVNIIAQTQPVNNVFPSDVPLPVYLRHLPQPYEPVFSPPPTPPKPHPLIFYPSKLQSSPLVPSVLQPLAFYQTPQPPPLQPQPSSYYPPPLPPLSTQPQLATLYPSKLKQSLVQPSELQPPDFYQSSYPSPLEPHPSSYYLRALLSSSQQPQRPTFFPSKLQQSPEAPSELAPPTFYQPPQPPPLQPQSSSYNSSPISSLSPPLEPNPSSYYLPSLPSLSPQPKSPTLYQSKLQQSPEAPSELPSPTFYQPPQLPPLQPQSSSYNSSSLSSLPPPPESNPSSYYLPALPSSAPQPQHPTLYPSQVQPLPEAPSVLQPPAFYQPLLQPLLQSQPLRLIARPLPPTPLNLSHQLPLTQQEYVPFITSQTFRWMYIPDPQAHIPAIIGPPSAFGYLFPPFLPYLPYILTWPQFISLQPFSQLETHKASSMTSVKQLSQSFPSIESTTLPSLLKLKAVVNDTTISTRTFTTISVITSTIKPTLQPSQSIPSIKHNALPSLPNCTTTVNATTINTKNFTATYASTTTIKPNKKSISPNSPPKWTVPPIQTMFRYTRRNSGRERVVGELHSQYNFKCLFSCW